MVAVPLARSLASRHAIAAEPWVIEGPVVGITGGDTIVALDGARAQHKSRLAGIDALEGGQAFGYRAKESLSRLAFDKQVEAHCQEKDRYSREVCKVTRGGIDMNLEQLRAGMAWCYRKCAKEQSAEDRASYGAAEDDARAMRRGLWKDTTQVPPWEWRPRFSEDTSLRLTHQWITAP